MKKMEESYKAKTIDMTIDTQRQLRWIQGYYLQKNKEITDWRIIEMAILLKAKQIKIK